MRVEKDYEEFLGLLNKYQVKYCIAGSYAVAVWGYPRYTKDIDILIEPTKENAKKIISAIREFGIKSQDLTEEDFIKKNRVIQLGYEPVRIDILTSVEGVSFSTIWRNKVEDFYGKEKVYFVGLKELIRIKKKVARPQDLVDLEELLRRKKWRKKKK
ncbi:MAG: hypothetical protein DRP68_06655 [Candidatus Omnitrophota bacterium]|nr:nucleotidyl transferase AbiEii/AbiGii toxin family protein [Candidatus Omnitrophota bacterium]RKY29956.1 MAG: hypothetical protein DRP68_06655 [Candidatus Omnitrophota bacterium]HDN86309.1 hypothetical protein [Candidatus Omnitrophota bacterium]